MKIYLTPSKRSLLSELSNLASNACLSGPPPEIVRRAGRQGEGNSYPSAKLKRSILFVFLLTINLTLNAQLQVQNFSLTNVLDGKTISLDQYSSSVGVAILFTSNGCPFDNYYKDRIKEMIRTYSGKVQFLLVNSYIEPEESTDKMANHYTDLNAPYLSDKDQVVMTALGAKKSPEVFLLKNSSGKFITTYRGAIDDNPQVPKDANQKFLRNAIDQLLVGQKTDVVSNRAVGCSMRRK